MRIATYLWLGCGLVLAALPASAQGNEFYLNVKVEVVDGSVRGATEGSAVSLTKAISDKGWRQIAPDLRAQLDKVVNERLTLEMLKGDNVLGALGLDVPQGSKYIVLGYSRVHLEHQTRISFVYKSTLTVRVLDVETQRVAFAEDIEGTGNAVSREQAAIDADKDAGAKMAAQLFKVLPAPAAGDWFRIRLTYADRRGGLQAYQKIRGWPMIQEAKRVSTDETTMLIEVRSELSQSDFQDEFELFILDTFPKAKLDFARSVFNVHIDGDSAASPTAQCEASDEAPNREPPTRVEAAGFGVIENGNVDAARKEALFQAFRAAVEQGVHVYIDSSTVVENFETIEDKIYTEASGFVESHEILEEGQADPNTYRVRIRAVVRYGKLKETLASLHLLQEQIGHLKAAIVYEWLPYDANPRGPVGPVSEARVMRMSDGPANDAVSEATRFLQKKKFTVYDQMRMRAFYDRLARSEQVHESEAAVVDMLTQEEMPCDLVLFVTVWSEGVQGAGERAIVHSKVQVKSYLPSTQKILGVKERRGQQIIAGGNSGNPVRELSVLSQRTTCELVREFWPEFRGALEEEKTFEIYLRNFNAEETKTAIKALKTVRGVKAVVRNRVADRFASLTVYTVGTMTPDQFIDGAQDAVGGAMMRRPKERVDRQILNFSYDTYIED